MQRNQSRPKQVPTDWMNAAASRFPSRPLIERKRFVMEAPLVELVRRGCKSSTIRFDEGGIEYPASEVMPVYSVEPGEGHETARRAADVRVASVAYVRSRDLSDEDARVDGFPNRAELLTALKAYYPGLQPDSLVVVYRFVGSSCRPQRARNTATGAEPRLSP